MPFGLELGQAKVLTFIIQPDPGEGVSETRAERIELMPGWLAKTRRRLAQDRVVEEPVWNGA